MLNREIEERAASARALAKSPKSYWTFARELDRPASREDNAVVLRYAIKIAEGDQVRARLSPRTAKAAGELGGEIANLKHALVAIERSCRSAREHRLDRENLPGWKDDADAVDMVLQIAGGRDFQVILSQVYRQHGFLKDPFHVPAEGVYEWAVSIGLLETEGTNRALSHLISVDDDSFVSRLLRDAGEPGGVFRHDALIERRLRVGPRVDELLRKRAVQAETVLKRRPRGSGDPLQRLGEAYRDWAIFAARQREAKFDFFALIDRVRSLQRSGTSNLHPKAVYLRIAAGLADERQPGLYAAATEAWAAHSVEGPDHVGCGADCIRRVAREMPTRVQSTTVPLAVGPRGGDPTTSLMGPHDVRIGAPTVTNASSRCLTWQQPLRAQDIARSRCPLPPEMQAVLREQSALDGWRMLLVLEHDSSPAGPTLLSRAATASGDGPWLRIEGGWPTTFFAGIIVLFTWDAFSGSLNASTQRLHCPTWFHGHAISHLYDLPTLTRDLEPTQDVEPRAPKGRSATTTSVVLRILRVLGYLDASGCAMLTEDALLMNIVKNGRIAKNRLGEVDAAIQGLLDAGRLERRDGSVDQSGQPYHPPQPGQARVCLLCYRPSIAYPSMVRLPEKKSKRPSDQPGESDVKGHPVSGHVRRLPPNQRASDEKKAQHRAAIRAGLVVDRGTSGDYSFTWVEDHKRDDRKQSRKKRRGGSGGDRGREA